MQPVGTPTIFIDYFQWALAIGLIDNDSFNHEQENFDISSLFTLEPTNAILLPEIAGTYPFTQMEVETKFSINQSEQFDYYMILNHNLFTTQSRIYGYRQTGSFVSDEGFTTRESFGYIPQVNEYSGDGPLDSPEYNGWTYYDISQSIVNFTHLCLIYYGQPTVGSISVGHKYVMPSSPDMQLTLERDFGGISSRETMGGKTLTNVNYNRSPLWTSEPWGLYTEIPENLNARRLGRRIWNLKFSHISESDLFAETEMLNENGYDNPDDVVTFADSNTLLARFIQYTLNGKLKFIFQPDNTNFSPDGFAICTLDQDGIKMTQTSFKTYDISLKIRECW